jgi:hypothetical protein
MNIILFDGPFREHLLPLTFTRPVCDLRIGILTIREKWEKYLGNATSTLTEDYLQKKYPLQSSADNLLVHGAVCPTPALVDAIKGLKLVSNW